MLSVCHSYDKLLGNEKTRKKIKQKRKKKYLKGSGKIEARKQAVQKNMQLTKSTGTLKVRKICHHGPPSGRKWALIPRSQEDQGRQDTGRDDLSGFNQNVFHQTR